MAIEPRPSWWTQFGRSLLQGIAGAGIGAGEYALRELISDYFRKGMENRLRQHQKEMLAYQQKMAAERLMKQQEFAREQAEESHREASKRTLASILGGVSPALGAQVLDPEQKLTKTIFVPKSQQSEQAFMPQSIFSVSVPPNLQNALLSRLGVEGEASTPEISKVQAGPEPAAPPQLQEKSAQTEKQPLSPEQQKLQEMHELFESQKLGRSKTAQAGLINLARDVMNNLTRLRTEAMRQYGREKSDAAKMVLERAKAAQDALQHSMLSKYGDPTEQLLEAQKVIEESYNMLQGGAARHLKMPGSAGQQKQGTVPAAPRTGTSLSRPQPTDNELVRAIVEMSNGQMSVEQARDMLNRNRNDEAFIQRLINYVKSR